MSDLVNGKDVVVYIYVGGQWVPYVCASSCSLTINTEILETSVSGYGTFATYIPTKDSFSGTLEGVVDLATSTDVEFPDLQSMQLSHTLLLMRFIRTSQGGQIYTSECRFYITRSSDTGSYDNMNTYSVELQGTGVLTQIFTPSTPVSGIVKRYEFTGTEGATGFTDATLINKDILEANKDGIGNSKIILSGTPVNKEVKYTSGTGTFEWAIPFADGEEAFILYYDL